MTKDFVRSSNHSTIASHELHAGKFGVPGALQAALPEELASVEHPIYVRMESCEHCGRPLYLVQVPGSDTASQSFRLTRLAEAGRLPVFLHMQHAVYQLWPTSLVLSRLDYAELCAMLWREHECLAALEVCG